MTTNQDRIDELKTEIERRLSAHPETGAEWADICALENEMVSLRRNAAVAEPLREIINAFTPFIR